MVERGGVEPPFRDFQSRALTAYAIFPHGALDWNCTNDQWVATTCLSSWLLVHGESGYIENHHEAISATYTVVRNTNIVALSTLWPRR